MASPTESEALKQALKEAREHSEPQALFKGVIADIGRLAPPLRLATAFNAVADEILDASLGVVATRSLFDDFIGKLRESDDHELWIEVGRHVIGRIATGGALASSLVEQAARLRELVATAHEANEDFAEAARALAEIPLETSQRRVPDADKAAIWVRIVRNHLEVDDSTAAEAYLNKLKNVMHTVADPELQLHFRLSAARVHDSNHQFLPAAKAYHDISLAPAVAEEERLHTLAMAIKCAILAPAGPLRSRMLGQLYKDERSAGLGEFGILESMFLDRLLSPAEVDKFAQGLAPHHLATTSDGSTVLARAVVEHNLLSASRVYLNIGFDELGVLLGLDGDKAEDTTAKMIEQGRLSGSIDQIDRIIYFGGGDASGEKGSGRAEAQVGKETRRLDSNVQALAEDLERVTDALQAEFPDFVAAHSAV